MSNVFTGFNPAPDVIRDTIDPMAAMVFGVVWRFSQMGRGQCDATIETIAKRAGFGTTTVRERLRLLEADRWITAESRPGRPTIYHDAGRWILQVAGVDQDEQPQREALPSPQRVALAPQREALPPPTAGVAPPQREALPKIERATRKNNQETTEEDGGACAPDTPSPSAVDEVRDALAAWARLDLARAGEDTRLAFVSLAAVQAASGIDAAYVRYCGIRWYEEHWAGRDTNRPMPKRRPANTRQMTDWIATCLCDAKPGDSIVEARLAGFSNGPLADADPAPPTPAATDAAAWPEPHLAPVLEALGYTPLDCPPGERLAVDRLLSSASVRFGVRDEDLVEAARRVAGRSQVTDRRRVAELQLELDAMAVRA